MRSFDFSRASSASEAIGVLKENGKFIAGGTNLVDLMKEGVEQPSQLVDIQRLPLASIQASRSGGVSLGALAKNTDTANHPLIRRNYPLLTQAILAGASPQIRNMATNGGNLLQRTRCVYFYDVAMPCNKREAGTGCGAIGGLNKNHAIFGWSESCVATFPSDMSVALAALDAKVRILGRDGKERTVDFADFHRLPGTEPSRDNNLAPGELIVAIDLPKARPAARSHYIKVRNRASYAFALVSVAAIYEIKAGKVVQPRIVLGGVAHKPWRAFDAEQFLSGKPATDESFKQCAEIAVKDARPLSQNSYKIPMAQRAIVRALKNAK